MDDLKDILAQELKNFPIEILEAVGQVIQSHESKMIERYRSISVIHGSDALLEAKLPDERIILLLQKHYDLRRSEAEKVLQQAKNRATRQQKSSNDDGNKIKRSCH